MRAPLVPRIHIGHADTQLHGFGLPFVLPGLIDQPNMAPSAIDTSQPVNRQRGPHPRRTAWRWAILVIEKCDRRVFSGQGRSIRPRAQQRRRLSRRNHLPAPKRPSKAPFWAMICPRKNTVWPSCHGGALPRIMSHIVMQIVGAVGRCDPHPRSQDRRHSLPRCGPCPAIRRGPQRLWMSVGRRPRCPRPRDTIASSIGGKRGSKPGRIWRFGESLLEVRQITCRFHRGGKARDRKTRDLAPGQQSPHSAAWSASVRWGGEQIHLPHADATGFPLSETNNADRFPPKLAPFARAAATASTAPATEMDALDLGIPCSANGTCAPQPRSRPEGARPHDHAGQPGPLPAEQPGRAMMASFSA